MGKSSKDPRWPAAGLRALKNVRLSCDRCDVVVLLLSNNECSENAEEWHFRRLCLAPAIDPEGHSYPLSLDRSIECYCQDIFLHYVSAYVQNFIYD